MQILQVSKVFPGIDRRALLFGGSALLLTACGGGGGGSTTPATIVLPTPSPAPTPSPVAVASGATGVRQFYRPEHGANLQPAFQAALDAAAANGSELVVNDLVTGTGEMWCPPRTSPYGSQTDGIPLVVRMPVSIDFKGAAFRLKGPTGGDRMIGQKVAGFEQPWLGGWLYVVGHTGFGRVTVENVSVDGGFSGSVTTNADSNITDKGFRVQDTEVSEVYMRNVELKNFAGEIYYIGGLGPKRQQIEDCHFHGSAQCAWNPGGVGTVMATNLQAGRAYQVAEVVGGKGHTYVRGRFYDAGGGGATFFGGPSPGFVPGFPYNYAYWDGRGEKPWIDFRDTRFDHCRAVRLGAWSRGKIVALETPVWLNPSVGHLRDIELEVDSWCDTSRGIEAIGVFGPSDLVTQMAGAPVGTYIKMPSDINLKVNCFRTDFARANGSSHVCGIRFFSGLVDANSIRLEVTGEARQASELFGAPPPGFLMPSIKTDGFTAIGA